MNCYDCATQDHLARPAVSTCTDCGAAVCEHHLVVRDHHRTRTVTMMRVETIEPAARIMRCATCDVAYVSAHQRPETRKHPGGSDVTAKVVAGA